MKRDRHGQAEPLTPETYRRIREVFLEESHKLVWDILWFTGERVGAVLQLPVDDVYSDATRKITQPEITFKASTRKDKTTRQVPLHTDLRSRLKAYDPPSSGYLFPGRGEKGHLTHQAYDAAFRRALARCGLDGFGYSLHSPRRGFITRLHTKGMGIKVIQSLTGHQSLAVLSRYIEVSDEMRREAINLI